MREKTLSIETRTIEQQLKISDWKQRAKGFNNCNTKKSIAFILQTCDQRGFHKGILLRQIVRLSSPLAG